MKRNTEIMQDSTGNKVVVIRDIRFTGRQNIDWKEVEKYLEDYVGELYQVAETQEAIYIGKEMPGEYAGSRYTFSLKGANAKAKANAAQGIPELICIASGKKHKENEKEKHRVDAKYGWYRYDSGFALPVYDEEHQIERYNVFHCHLIVRHDADGKKYLYDVINIKKEPSNPPSLLHTVKNSVL